jgi:CHASE3 domain sensor protein
VANELLRIKGLEAYSFDGRAMKDKQFNILRWTPVGITIGLMILIAGISYRTVSALKQATYWREHTFKVILETQALEDKLLDAQNGVDRYVANGVPSMLVEYQNDTNIEARDFDELLSLTSDNPAQRQRLKDLSEAVQAVFTYDNRVLAIYSQNGAKAAEQADEGAEQRQVLEPAIKDVEKFKDAEQKLLKERDTDEQIDYHKAAHMLVIGSVIAALVLILSNSFAGREMARRRQSEVKQRELIDELQKSLAEVKTLSGLIPICGWCKSVRADTGFWQSVEQYVRARTDARFSHGMCPVCAEKWKKQAAGTNKSLAA